MDWSKGSIWSRWYRRDKIVTKSGLHGKVAELAETTVIIETMSGKLKMERSAISMEMSAALAKK